MQADKSWKFIEEVRVLNSFAYEASHSTQEEKSWPDSPTEYETKKIFVPLPVPQINIVSGPRFEKFFDVIILQKAVFLRWTNCVM